MKKEIVITPFTVTVANAKLFIECLGDGWKSPSTLTPKGLDEILYIENDIREISDSVVSGVRKLGIAYRITEDDNDGERQATTGDVAQQS